MDPHRRVAPRAARARAARRRRLLGARSRDLGELDVSRAARAVRVELRRDEGRELRRDRADCGAGLPLDATSRLSALRARRRGTDVAAPVDALLFDSDAREPVPAAVRPRLPSRSPRPSSGRRCSARESRSLRSRSPRRPACRASCSCPSSCSSPSRCAARVCSHRPSPCAVWSRSPWSAKLVAGGLGVYEGHRGAHYTVGGVAVWLVAKRGGVVARCRHRAGRGAALLAAAHRRRARVRGGRRLGDGCARLPRGGCRSVGAARDQGALHGAGAAVAPDRLRRLARAGRAPAAVVGGRDSGGARGQRFRSGGCSGSRRCWATGGPCCRSSGRASARRACW